MQTMPVAVADDVRYLYEEALPFDAEVREEPVDHARLYEAMVQHKPYLLRVAFSILKHHEDAEDAVQAGYLSAWKAWERFRGGASLKTWLTSIVMNKALTELRTKRRKTWMSMDADPAFMMEVEWALSGGQVSPEFYAIQSQQMGRVQARLRDLPTATKQVVMLRYVDELSVDEIARVQGTTRGSVKGHIRRGCLRLREECSHAAVS
jgi:RNA polymerase sigma-70 factor (ECF subfamily)